MPAPARAAPPPLSSRGAREAGGPGAAPRSIRRFAWVAYVAFAGAAVAFYGCPIARLLHTPCPACGTTRAGLALLRGDVCAALALQPVAPLVFALFGALFARALWLTSREGSVARLFEGRVGRAIVVAFAACALAELALWIARFYGALGGPVPV